MNSSFLRRIPSGSPLKFELMQTFILNAGKPLDTAFLLDHLWGQAGAKAIPSGFTFHTCAASSNPSIQSQNYRRPRRQLYSGEISHYPEKDGALSSNKQLLHVEIRFGGRMNSNSIRKLRKKFILVAMVSIALVMFFMSSLSTSPMS